MVLPQVMTPIPSELFETRVETTEQTSERMETKVETIKQEHVNKLLSGFDKEFEGFKKKDAYFENLEEQLKLANSALETFKKSGASEEKIEQYTALTNGTKERVLKDKQIHNRAKKIFVEWWIRDNLYSRGFEEFATLMNDETYTPQKPFTETLIEQLKSDNPSNIINYDSESFEEEEFEKLKDVQKVFETLKKGKTTDNYGRNTIPLVKSKVNNSKGRLAQLRPSILSYVALKSKTVIAIYGENSRRAFSWDDFTAAKNQGASKERAFTYILLNGLKEEEKNGLNSPENGLFEVVGLYSGENKHSYFLSQVDLEGNIRGGSAFEDYSKYVPIE